jgi:hypothetical protein
LFDSNQILNGLNALCVPIGPIGTPNRPYDHLIAPREAVDLEARLGGENYTNAIEGTFQCNVNPRGVLKW